jgi:hypothetical protein
MKRSGPGAAPASRSAMPVGGGASRTSGTSGPCGAPSSSSDVLQSSLESRLRARLFGSSTCAVVWRPWTTPWGQFRSKPRARVRSSSETDFGLWPSLLARDAKSENSTTAYHEKRMGESRGKSLGRIIIGLWSTLRATDGEKGGPRMSFGAGGSPLPSQVWETGSTSGVLTENGGRSLHPEFAGWEMGFPPEWLSCAPSVIHSTPRQRPNS